MGYSTMKKKIVNKLIYHGLGFPIELHHVEMVFLDNEWHPKIDVRKVSDAAIKALASQQERLTGNQVKFIRTYFSMTLREFAKEVLQVSHTAVNKWEQYGDKATNMDINIEKILRLYIYEKTCMKTAKEKREFYEKYLDLKRISLTKLKSRHIVKVV